MRADDLVEAFVAIDRPEYEVVVVHESEDYSARGLWEPTESFEPLTAVEIVEIRKTQASTIEIVVR